MRKKLAVFIALAVMVSCLSGIPVSAVSYSGEGAGTDENPYIITTAEEFNQIHSFKTAVFELRTPAESGITLNNPTPITNFKGKLYGKDGQNTINLNIDRSGSTERATLFDSIAENAILDNLVLTGDVTGGNTGYTSALVGYIAAGSNVQVTNISSYAAVTIHYAADSNLRSGGLIGAVYNNSASTNGTILIENCVNYGQITYTPETEQTADFGGVIGEIGSGNDTITVRNCENHEIGRAHV